MIISLDRNPTAWIIYRLAWTHDLAKDTDPRKAILIARVFGQCRHLLRRWNEMGAP